MTDIDLLYVMAVACLISMMLLASKWARMAAIGIVLVGAICGAAVMGHG